MSLDLPVARLRLRHDVSDEAGRTQECELCVLDCSVGGWGDVVRWPERIGLTPRISAVAFVHGGICGWRALVADRWRGREESSVWNDLPVVLDWCLVAWRRL
jgi:hypothetical protein